MESKIKQNGFFVLVGAVLLVLGVVVYQFKWKKAPHQVTSEAKMNSDKQSEPLQPQLLKRDTSESKPITLKQPVKARKQRINKEVMLDTMVSIEEVPAVEPLEEPIQEVITCYTDSGNGTIYLREKEAEPQGGMREFYKYLAKSITLPKGFREVDHKVFVSFLVDTDGSLKDIQVLKPTNVEGLEEEMTTILQNGPKWRSATQRGRKVPQKFTLPILFHIR